MWILEEGAVGRACCGVKGKSLFPLVFGDPGNEPLDAAGQVPGVAPLLPVEKPLGAYERVGTSLAPPGTLVRGAACALPPGHRRLPGAVAGPLFFTFSSRNFLESSGQDAC